MHSALEARSHHHNSSINSVNELVLVIHLAAQRATRPLRSEEGAPWWHHLAGPCGATPSGRCSQRDAQTPPLDSRYSHGHGF